MENVPPPVEVRATFGHYTLEGRAEGADLLVERRYESHLQVVSPEEYRALVDHYEEISRADSSQVVLNWR
jgi:hypothetical protein